MWPFLVRYRNYQNQTRANAPYDIRFYNFWRQEVTDMWFYRFIEHRQLKKQGGKICFYSTFGDRSIIQRTAKEVNVFFSGENLKTELHLSYADHCLSEDSIDLALGFECFDEARYMRFPLWLMYMFEPESDDEAIERRCAELSRPSLGTRQRFACHVSSDDVQGLRREICSEVSTIHTVDCAGKFMHNCDDLWQVFGDDKHRFLSEYKINICPENSNCQGYVTEKLFQAIDAGCVPVYWGSYNNPEPDVVNRDAIVFWNQGGDNTANLEFIRRLNESQALFDEFAHQPRLRNDAAAFVVEKFNTLENRIRELL